jgi:hypothetical protein
MPHRVHDMATATQQRLLDSAAASGHPQLQAAVSVWHTEGSCPPMDIPRPCPAPTHDA